MRINSKFSLDFFSLFQIIKVCPGVTETVYSGYRQYFMKDGWDLGAVVEEREEGQGPTGHLEVGRECRANKGDVK